MYCPQCGRESELDGDTRFCRYCGLALGETRDNLRGFTDVKREGYKFINLSFVLAAILFWIQYFGLIAWTSFWGGNFLLILIFGFIFGLWFMGNWVADRPAKYVKNKDANKRPKLTLVEKKPLPSDQADPIPARDIFSKPTTELVENRTVTDDTTRKLS